MAKSLLFKSYFPETDLERCHHLRSFYEGELLPDLYSRSLKINSYFSIISVLAF